MNVTISSLKTHHKYINRDLSWLQFNARVLQEAEDPSVPVLERLRFLGIFSNNLDEFFKVRYATIKRIVEVGKGARSELGGISASELLEEITHTVIDQQQMSLDILEKIQEELRDENIYIINETEISPSQSKFISEYFIRVVSPALVTIMLSEVEEFPSLKDSAAYLAVRMVMQEGDDTFASKINYALIEIPRVVNRFVVLPEEDGRKYIIILDDLIRHCLRNIFSIFYYESISAHMIKITRDAELDIDSDLSRSFLEKISQSVAKRSSGDPVRFVYDSTIEEDTLAFLMKKMGIDNMDSIIPGGRYHNRRDYMKFPSLGRKDLMYEVKEPLPIPGLSLQGSLLDKIAKKDYLLYAPYQTFSYVVKFLREAALDPKVQSIKMTIYRLAEVSHIASSLINAAKNGKQVTVQIELRARFDEAANISYAEQMQEEGVKLIFGVAGLKVHCKACVVERLEQGKLKRYSFISTGNFNESTAKIYTDYTLFTANEKIGKEINKVFNFFEVNYQVKKYRHLIVSPHYTRNAFYHLIDHEIENHKKGLPSGIKLKLNSLSDFKMIDKLYHASQAGVKIQLIVRGICSLIPGIPGMSENIEAISIVDKFLEHPRLYIFENGGHPKYFISSADFMTRNLDTRVEITCPIYDEDIQKELLETFEISWSDNVKARIITKDQDNAYLRNELEEMRSQFALYDYYKKKLN
ncbi:MAG TPA: polyphosphate kinase 1 [Flavobacteriaceae bacterium]|nr:polyphosphate kinase 1 [Flavobacteriaceae bacterium]MCB9213335.1 polyphosphate kinase 1 [Alteromonas sp.]HPF10225.1 polyphosphate kinase 1 [Flavobacteriaceae bacterium]HQU20671.1 polyphosphate kinase 1 [Flavobacteriaceae bacterium]HQU64911.1 polyphosphate kinase 1 [Flavobacteriaceae bacterium]